MSHVSVAVSAIVATLKGASLPLTVDRVRLRPLSASAIAAVVVRPEHSDVAEYSLAPDYPVQWSVVVRVECYARVTPGNAPDDAIDATASAVYAALMADPSLGGAVRNIEPQGVAYDFDAVEDNFVCAILTFHVRQTSAAGSF